MRIFVNKDEFIKKVESGIKLSIDAIIHMGANSSTTEKNADQLISNNFEYTKILAKYCLNNWCARFIYASYTATYGDGSQGFNDEEKLCQSLTPLNMYGYSKNLFDIWAIKHSIIDKIVGLKYFNVFGPNEAHKGDMRGC